MSLLDDLLENGRTGLYVEGKWRPASDGRTIEVRDPADGEVIAEVASASVEDGLEAVRAASEAAQAWRETAPRQRGELLRGAFELMRQRSEAFAELIVRENGKALGDARGEVLYAAEFFRWYSEEAVR
ncbi:MAG: aldehyde dehydrogenase family protein, partial [Acidimicrobiia bacterium]